MKLNINTTDLVLMGLLLQKGFATPINSSNGKNLNITTLANSDVLTSVYIPNTTNASSSILSDIIPISTKNTVTTTNVNSVAMPTLGEFETMINNMHKQIPNAKLTKRSISFKNQEELNIFFKQEIGKLLNSANTQCPEINWDNKVDLLPYIQLIEKKFPKLESNEFSLRDACDYALKETCDDYSNRDNVSKDKNTKRLLTIILPSVLVPSAVLSILALVCFGCIAKKSFH